MKKTTRLTALLLALVLLLANLSASATETGIRIEDLNAETYSALLQAASEGTSGADVTVCGTEYCENVLYMLEQCPTAQAKYEYLMTLYTEVPEDEMATQEDLVLEYTLLHYAECHVADMEDFTTYEVCTCAFPLLAPDSVPGDISKHSEDCPWHFANLTTAEQYTVSIMLASYDETTYIRTLSATQATALATYTAQQNGTLSYPCEEKPEYCKFSEYSQLSATEIYDYFNAIYDDGNGEISELYAAMMLHYGEYHQASNLLCICGGHPLPLPEYEIGDISVHESTCPWHFANLTTPEQYDVICLMSTSAREPYMAVLTTAQITALDDYINSLGNSNLCDGSCQYMYIVEMGGIERYNYLLDYYHDSLDEEGYPSWEWAVLLGHLRDEHIADNVVCQCANFNIADPAHGYGMLHHTGYGSLVCPWHFDQLPDEDRYEVFKQMSSLDQYRVIKDLDTESQDSYTAKLGQTQYAALMDYIGKITDSTVEKTATIEKTEETGTAAQITVPAGVFGDDVKYVMNAEETTVVGDEQAAIEEIGHVQVLAAYDISFDNVNTGEKLKPINGTVELTFEVETSKITGSELRVYHMQANADGTYTAELMGAVEVDRTKDVQVITVQADEFSDWVAATNDCDGTACYTHTDGTVISLESLKAMTLINRYATLMSLFDEGTTLETLMLHLAFVHGANVGSVICDCAGTPLLYAPGAAGLHDDDCIWRSSVMASPSGAELYEAYKELDVPHRTYFMSGLDADQRTALATAMNGGADGIDGLIDTHGFDIANWMMGKRTVIDGESTYVEYVENGVHDWLTEQTEVTVTTDMISRAYEVEIELENRSADYFALQALRLETAELMSVYTGTAIADYDAATGAITDRSMGLIVGYADTESGTIVAPPVDETTGGDDTTN